MCFNYNFLAKFFVSCFHFHSSSQIRILQRIFWGKMLFSLGSLRFQFEPDFRDSVGFCSYWSMIHINLCIFGIFWKIEISGYMEAEYVGWPKNAPKIFLGDNRLCGIYEPQNVENHHFRKFRISAPQDFNMSKIRQNLENLVHIEIWALLRFISKISAMKNLGAGHAQISPPYEKCEKNRKFFFPADNSISAP